MKSTGADARLAVLAGPLAAVLLTVSPAVSQRFRASVHLVTVTATVKDSQGTYVDHLQPENFVLYEDDVRQTIAHFSHSPDPAVSVDILLDVRVNMARKMKTAIYAIERFVGGLRKDGRKAAPSCSSSRSSRRVPVTATRSAS